MHNFFLANNPILYKLISNLRRKINYEKILYLENIHKGFVVLDVGANKGYFTSLFSFLVGKNGKVHAFEPVPETYQELINLKTAFQNVCTNNLAVGEKSGQATISYDPNDREKATLIQSSSSFTKLVETKVVSIDQYVKNSNLKFVDFIKCDVEGFELEVLLGAVQTLSNFSPKISIEMTQEKNEIEEAIHILKRAGYSNFVKIEKNFPNFDYKTHNFSEEYFYLYATC